MRNVREGELVKFVKGRSDEIEKILFPESPGEIYLVVSPPRMSVYSDPNERGGRTHETLTVEIARGTLVRKVPVNILRVVKSKKRDFSEAT